MSEFLVICKEMATKWGVSLLTSEEEICPVTFPLVCSEISIHVICAVVFFSWSILGAT